MQVYAKLQARVESPKFLLDMESSFHDAAADETAGSGRPADEDDAVQFDVNSPGWWGEGEVSAVSDVPSPPPSVTAAAEEGYVMVEKEDVIDALAAFIAGYVAAHPRASTVPPEKLQRALGAALGELRAGDRGQVRQLWDWGKSVYRGVAWTYGTLTAFSNPWITRLLLAAVYTGARITCGVAAAVV